MANPVILTFVGCYLPGYKDGGPVRTIANMVEQLGDQLDFRIVTKDRESSDVAPYPGVVVDGWNTVGKAKVFYASKAKLSIINISELVRDTKHDVLYLNSFFCYPFSIRLLLARLMRLIPRRYTVIAPRGELSAVSLEIKSWKKAPFLTIARALGVYNDLVWQASSIYELEDIRRVMGAAAKQVAVAPNLPAFPNVEIASKQHRKPSPGEPLRVCFLSRISIEKNLDYALRVLALVRVPIDFGIYGTVSDEPYWQRCKELFQGLPTQVTVHYYGEITHANVAQKLSEYDLFFLPTTGENYGHVIFEALASGLPILISDQTPWRNLAAIGVGWDLPLNSMEKFREVIETHYRSSDTEKSDQRQRARLYARQIAMDEKVLANNLALFRGFSVLNREQSGMKTRNGKTNGH